VEKKQDPCIHCQSIEAPDAFLARQQNPTVDRPQEADLFLDHLKRLCEASFDGVVIFEKGVIVASNRQFAELFGYTPEELTGMNIFALCTPKWHSSLMEKMVSGCQRAYEAVGLKKNGVQFPIEIRAGECGMDGRHLHMMACRDMTSHKQIENQLLLKQEELKAVFEASMDCITVWDKDCNCLYANQMAVDYIHMSLDKVVGKNICESLSQVPEFLQYWKSRIELIFETKKFMRLTDTISLGGKMVYGEAILSPIRYSDGKLLAVGVVYRDITEHIHAGIKLKVSEERFKRLSETLFEAIMIHRKGEILDANQKFLDMFGYTSQEIPFVNGLKLFAPQSQDLIRKNVASGYEGIYEVLGVKKDGTNFPVEIQARESVVDGVAVRIVAIKDLNRRREMQRQIVESEKKFRELYDSAVIPLYRTRLSDGKLLECNLALANMLGYGSKEECLREHYSAAHYVNPAQRAQLLAKLEKEKYVAGYEVEFKRVNGAYAWAEITARINSVEGYAEGAQIDITASKVLGPIEKEILKLIMQGKSNKEIARLMHRSIRTTEDHRSNIMKKLGAGNMVELVKIGQFLAYRSEK
jgi:PAS domain S-box-containing protein